MGVAREHSLILPEVTEHTTYGWEGSSNTLY